MDQNPLWLSLMFSTGYLLLICGVPGTLGAALLFSLNGTLTKGGAIQFAAVMVACELALAGVLLFAAARVRKYRGQADAAR